MRLAQRDAERLGRMRPTIRLGLDSADARAKMRAIEREASRLGRMRPTITVHADTAGAAAKLRAIERSAARLGRLRPNVSVRADTTVANARLRSVESAARRVGRLSPSVRVKADTTAANTRLRGTERVAHSLGRVAPNVRVKADTATARTKLRVVSTDLKKLGLQTAHPKVDLKAEKFRAEDIRVRVQLKRLGAQQANPNVKLQTGAFRTASLGVRASLKNLGRQEAHPNVELKGVGGAIAEMGILKTAMLLLGPASIPVLAAITGATIAMGSALATAAVGFGIFGAAAISQLTPVLGATKELTAAREAYSKATTKKQRDTALAQEKEALKGLSPLQQQAVKNVDKLHAAWKNFGKTARVPIFKAFNSFIRIAINLMKAFEPVVKPVANVIAQFARGLERTSAGPGPKRFAKWLSVEAPRAIRAFLEAGKNFTKAIFNIFRAFSGGQQRSFLKWIQDVAAGFRRWTEGPGLKKFVEFVRKNSGPVFQALGALAKAIGQIVVALGPLGGVIVRALVPLATALGWIAKNAPWVIQGVYALVVAMKIWTIAQWALNIALDANPIGLLVIAIAAMIGAVYAAAKGSKIAQLALIALAGPVGYITVAIINLVKHWRGAWTGIRTAAVAVWRALQAVWNGIVIGAVYVWHGINRAWHGVVAAFHSVANSTRGIWRPLWNFIRTIAVAVARVIVAGVKVEWRALVAAFRWVRNTAVAVWHAIWSAIRSIARGAGAIAAFVRGAWRRVVAAFSWVRGTAVRAWRFLWNAVRSIARSVGGGIANFVRGAWRRIVAAFNWVRSTAGRAWRFLWNSVRSTVRSIANGAAILVRGAWRRVVAAFNWVRSVGGRAWRALWNFVRSTVRAVSGWVSNAVRGAWRRVVATFNWVRSVAGRAWRAFWGFVRSTVRSVAAWVSNAVRGAWRRVVESFNWVRRAASRAWNAFWHAVTTITRNTTRWISSAVRRAWQAVVSAFNWLRRTASNVWRAFWRWIVRQFNATKNWLIRAVRRAWATVVGAFNWLRRRAVAIWNALWNWVTRRFRGFIALTTRVTRSFVKFFTSRFNQLKGWIQNIWNALWTWVSNKFHALTSKIVTAAKAFGSAFQGIFKSIKDAVGKIWHGLQAAVAKPVNFVINTIWNNHLAKWGNMVLKAVGMKAVIPYGHGIAGFEEGGIVDKHGFANGGVNEGVLPGYSPGVDNMVARTPAGPVGLAGGEGILRPEVVKAPGVKSWLTEANARARKGGRGAAKEVGIPGFSGGGVVGGMPVIAKFDDGGILGSLSHWGEGIWGAVKGFGKVVKDKIMGQVAKLYDKLFKPWVNKGLNWLSGHGWGGQMVSGIARKVIDALISYLVSKTTPVSGEGQAGDVVKAAQSEMKDWKAGKAGNDSNNRYTKMFSMPGQPWCAMFVSYVLKKAGAGGAAPRSASAGAYNSMKPRKGPPQAGDIAVYRGGEHVNIRTGGAGSIGGNQSNAVSDAPHPNPTHVGVPKYKSGGSIAGGGGNAYFTTFEDTQTASGHVTANTVASSYLPLGSEMTVQIGSKSHKGVVDDFGPAKFVYDRHPGIAVIDLGTSVAKAVGATGGDKGKWKLNKMGKGKGFLGTNARGYFMGGVVRTLSPEKERQVNLQDQHENNRSLVQRDFRLAALGRAPRRRGGSLARAPQTVDERHPMARRAARGGPIKPGELTWVGEAGPELVRFGGASRVFDHETSLRMVKRGQAPSWMAMHARTALGGGRIHTVGDTQLSGGKPLFTSDLLAHLLGSPTAVSTAGKRFTNALKTFFTGRAKTGLIHIVNEGIAAIRRLASQGLAVAKKLKEFRSIVSTVSEGVTETLTIAGYTGLGSVKDMVDAMKEQQKTATTYRTNLAALRKKGISKDILTQLSGLDLATGSEFAKTLLGATAAQIKALNAAQKAGVAATTATGTAVATTVAFADPALRKEFNRLLKRQHGHASALLRRLAPYFGVTPGGRSLGYGRIKTFDSGGDLLPGLTIALNKTGRTESSVTAEWRDKVERSLSRLEEKKPEQMQVNVSFRQPIDPYTAANQVANKLVRALS